MKLKKVGSVLCATLMLAALLASCGTSSTTDGGTSNATNDANDDPKKASGSITMWEHGTGFEESTKKIIEAFEKEQPDIKTEYEIKDGNDYYSLLATAIQSGDGPDLFWTNGTPTPVMGDYVKNGVCMDLTDSVDFSVFEEEALKISTIEGKQYSVPWLTMDTRAAFYNKKMFEENGWKIPTKFSEFEKLLEDINAKGIIPISLSGVDKFALLFAFEPILSGMAPEYTKGLSDYSVKATDQPAADCLTKMLDWSDKGYFGKNWLGVADGNAETLAFTSGEAAMYITGSWAASTILENNPDLSLGAFQVPGEDGTTGLVGTPANGFSVNAKSKSLDAALAFANYCASLEAQTIWVQTQGAVSASPDIEPSTEIAKEISKSGAGNIYTSWQSVLSNYSSSGDAVTIWEEDFPKVFSKDITVDDFMKEISAEMK